MNNGVLVWIVIFVISAVGFFLIAAVVAVKGFFDLRLFLRHSNENDEIERESSITDKDFFESADE